MPAILDETQPLTDKERTIITRCGHLLLDCIDGAWFLVVIGGERGGLRLRRFEEKAIVVGFIRDNEIRGCRQRPEEIVV